MEFWSDDRDAPEERPRRFLRRLRRAITADQAPVLPAPPDNETEFRAAVTFSAGRTWRNTDTTMLRIVTRLKDPA